eukprot:524769_1
MLPFSSVVTHLLSCCTPSITRCIPTNANTLDHHLVDRLHHWRFSAISNTDWWIRKGIKAEKKGVFILTSHALDSLFIYLGMYGINRIHQSDDPMKHTTP